MTNLMRTTGTATAVAVSASATAGLGPPEPPLDLGLLGGAGTLAATALMGCVPARACRTGGVGSEGGLGEGVFCHRRSADVREVNALLDWRWATRSHAHGAS